MSASLNWRTKVSFAWLRPLRRRRNRGFTLLEVLIALVILALAMTALVQSFSTGLDGINRGEARVIAILHARSKLAEFTARSELSEGDWSGEFANGYRWQAILAPPAPDIAVGGGEEGPAPLPDGLKQLTVRVVWKRGEVTLTTLNYAGAVR